MSRGKSKYSLRGAIEDALKHARMDNCSFEDIHLKPEFPLPKKEEQVDAFIKNRTRLWRENWLIPALERALEKVKARDEKKYLCKKCQKPLTKHNRPYCTDPNCFYATNPQYATDLS